MIKRLQLPIISLLVLIVVSLFTRTYHLSTNPPSFYADEVDAGYQALVFRHQQSDYFGHRFPVHFQSLSDWRTSGYLYGIALLQTLGVPQELSIRLPSALFGTAAVVIFYYLTGSFVSGLLLALSPWALHYSRIGYEVMGMLFFIFLFIYCLRQFFSLKKPFYLYLSFIFLFISPYFYSTAKLFIFLILIAAIITWLPEFKKIPRRLLIVTVCISFFVSLPLIVDTVRGRAGYRFAYISIFTEPHREQITDTLRYQDILQSHPGEVGVRTPFHSFILHNKINLIVERFIKNYLLSFSPDFLFISGDQNLRHGFGGHGLMYSLDFILIFIGLYLFVKKPDSLGIFFLAVLILAPVPFALTRDSAGPHSTRLILMLPSLIYFSSLALKKYWLLVSCYFLLFFNFWHYYFVHYPQTSAKAWNSGYREAVQAAPVDSKIYFTAEGDSFLPFFLFYRRVLPPPAINRITSDNFDGLGLAGLYFFGNFSLNNTALLDPSAVYIVNSRQYQALNNAAGFQILKKISKSWQESEEFYLLKLKNGQL